MDAKSFFAEIFFKIFLLPLPYHKESIGTLGYQIGSKLREEIEFERFFVTDKLNPKFII